MKYQLRDYQEQASRAAVSAFLSGRSGLIVVPTGGGKSLVIADIAEKIAEKEGEPLLVLQPSREILQQNFEKYCSYGYINCGIYSASFNRKQIRQVTFATIGSIVRKKADFERFKYVMIDECHKVNHKGGMYEEFIHARNDRVVVGLSATPYRLDRGCNGYPMLKFITRVRGRIFQSVLYYCQISELLAKGYLARLTYYDLTGRTSFDISRVKLNSTGADFDEESMRMELERSGFRDELTGWVQRIMNPKKGEPRKGVLVFTQFVKESEHLCQQLRRNGIAAEVVSADTPKPERERILKDFKDGRVRVVANAATLTTGFDYPELDTVVMARATMSLALWYQIVGRAIRPSPGKVGWICDLCGNIQRFGHVEDLRIERESPNSSRWCIKSKGRQLTNVLITR